MAGALRRERCCQRSKHAPRLDDAPEPPPSTTTSPPALRQHAAWNISVKNSDSLFESPGQTGSGATRSDVRSRCNQGPARSSSRNPDKGTTRTTIPATPSCKQAAQDQDSQIAGSAGWSASSSRPKPFSKPGALRSRIQDSVPGTRTRPAQNSMMMHPGRS